MHVSMHKFSLKLALHLLILIATISTKAEDDHDVHDPMIKCGECPCENPCSPQLVPTMPPPPFPIPYLAPPPPRFVYVTELNPPPPPSGYVFTAGPPGNMYGSNPFDWQIYSSAPHILISHQIEMFLFMLVLFSTFQFLHC
ncbi:hypothetical protein C2S51_016887 [Perilla frutescens var. frutescens]|nr:hypothetical protein C2S51_016887 [Perilla frutescens var. frutescens]